MQNGGRAYQSTRDTRVDSREIFDEQKKPRWQPSPSLLSSVTTAVNPRHARRSWMMIASIFQGKASVQDGRIVEDIHNVTIRIF